MPSALLRACLQPGCPAIQAGDWCQTHHRSRERGRQRFNFDVRRWYRTARWFALRARVLVEEPFCRACTAMGLVSDTTDVDHIVPHRGDPAKFWNRRNLQGLCHTCHSRKTQRGE